MDKVSDGSLLFTHNLRDVTVRTEIMVRLPSLAFSGSFRNLFSEETSHSLTGQEIITAGQSPQLPENPDRKSVV